MKKLICKIFGHKPNKDYQQYYETYVCLRCGLDCEYRTLPIGLWQIICNKISSFFYYKYHKIKTILTSIDNLPF